MSPAPYGPDAGQPAHFYPRMNRWQFVVRVPKDFGEKSEVVWTLTSHGITNRAYGSLAPGYAMDKYLIQFEFGGQPVRGRKPPVVQLEGAKERSAKVGQPTQLIALVTDPGDPPPRKRRGGSPGGGRAFADGPRSTNAIGVLAMSAATSSAQRLRVCGSRGSYIVATLLKSGASIPQCWLQDWEE